jgi:hypothetical protein
VRHAARREEGLSRAERDAPVRLVERDLALEDVERLVSVVVDVQRRHVAAAAFGLDEVEAAARDGAVDVHSRQVVDEPQRPRRGRGSCCHVSS